MLPISNSIKMQTAVIIEWSCFFRKDQRKAMAKKCTNLWCKPKRVDLLKLLFFISMTTCKWNLKHSKNKSAFQPNSSLLFHLEEFFTIKKEAFASSNWTTFSRSNNKNLYYKLFSSTQKPATWSASMKSEPIKI